jgi:CubicO group peptidase (beta-lactamase class C family)
MKKRQRIIQIPPEHFDQRMRTLVEHRISPSLAVAVVQGDDTVIAQGYGWSDLEQATAASAETVYLYCSMTKLFTATALMQLRERGLLDLDRPVRVYLPDFPLQHPSGREITVRHLLSHSSGIANPIPVSWVHLAEEPPVNLDDFTKRLLAKHHRLTFEPGSRYAYSNLGYLVLGQVVERLSGQRYTDYIQQQILQVLDMHRTGFSSASLQDQDVATGYVRSWSMMGLLGRLLVDRRIFGATRGGYTAFHRFLIDGAPYGGLLGPVSELGTFLKAYLGGTFQGRRLLESSSIAEMLTPQRNHHGEEFSTSSHEKSGRIGLGWHLAGEGAMRSCYHIGGGAGYRSELRIYPSLGYGIGVMGNETSYDTGVITSMIVSAPANTSSAIESGHSRDRSGGTHSERGRARARGQRNAALATVQAALRSLGVTNASA